MTIIDYGLRFL